MKDKTIDKIGLFILGILTGILIFLILIAVLRAQVVRNIVLDEVCQTKYGPEYTFKEMANTNIVCKIQKVTQQTTIKKEPPTLPKLPKSIELPKIPDFTSNVEAQAVVIQNMG